jgi:hypothetical protein
VNEAGDLLTQLQHLAGVDRQFQSLSRPADTELCSIVYRMLPPDTIALFLQATCLLLVALAAWISGLLGARG